VEKRMMMIDVGVVEVIKAGRYVDRRMSESETLRNAKEGEEMAV
jgi:hypothetical protein